MSSIAREVRGGNDAARGGVRRPGRIDGNDEGFAKYLFADALRIDFEKRKKPAFEIAKVAFETRIKIADPGLEARRHGISDDGPHCFIWFGIMPARTAATLRGKSLGVGEVVMVPSSERLCSAAAHRRGAPSSQ